MRDAFIAFQLTGLQFLNFGAGTKLMLLDETVFICIKTMH